MEYLSNINSEKFPLYIHVIEKVNIIHSYPVILHNKYKKKKETKNSQKSMYISTTSTTPTTTQSFT